MTMYGWSTDLELGNELIDTQHKELFSRLEKLAQAVLADRGGSEIPGLVEFLATYVQTHLRDEERLMLTHNYPGYEKQKAAHAVFSSDVESWKNKEVNPALTVEVIDKSGNYFRDHVKQLDKELAAFLKSRK
ncbi:MAG: hemerythrin family protein [Thermodesulfobacteriota bacterium]